MSDPRATCGPRSLCVRPMNYFCSIWDSFFDLENMKKTRNSFLYKNKLNQIYYFALFGTYFSLKVNVLALGYLYCRGDKRVAHPWSRHVSYCYISAKWWLPNNIWAFLLVFLLQYEIDIRVIILSVGHQNVFSFFVPL
jgi:hypothetical protein